MVGANAQFKGGDMTRPMKGDKKVDQEMIKNMSVLHGFLVSRRILINLDQKTLRDLIFMLDNIKRHLKKYLSIRNEQGRGGK